MTKPLVRTLLKPGLNPYRAMVYLKEAGSATSREVHLYCLRHVSARRVTAVLCALAAAGHLKRLGSVREPGARSMVLYGPEKPAALRIVELQPVPHIKRQQDYIDRKRIKVASVFQFRGRVAINSED